MSSLNELGIIPECDIARADELARQHAEIEALKAERNALRGILCRMVQLAEFWINREDRRGYSEQQYKTWHALGYGSSAMREAAVVVAKVEGDNDE